MKTQELRHQVLSRLRAHTEYNSKRVRIEVDNSIVTLSGHVDGEVARAFLEGITRSIEGVTDVINLLKVEVASTSGLSGLRLT